MAVSGAGPCGRGSKPALKIYVDTASRVVVQPRRELRRRGPHMQASPAERFVTAFGELELVNALGLRLFRKEITAEQAKSSLKKV